MSQIARKGDLAVIAPWATQGKGPKVVGKIAKCGQHRLGMQVSVLSDPQIPYQPELWDPGVRISHIECQCGCAAWTPTRNLIPIRDPDADVSQETRKAVEA